MSREKELFDVLHTAQGLLNYYMPTYDGKIVFAIDAHKDAYQQIQEALSRFSEVIIEKRVKE